MSTRTTYYNLTKPDADEHVLRTVINQNYDAIDLQMHANAEAAQDAAESLAAPYDENTSYSAGDFCIYQNKLLKANKTTTGTFTPADWDETTIEAEFTPRQVWSLFGTETADGTTRTIRVSMPAKVNGIFVQIRLTTGTTNSEFGVVVKATNRHGIGDISNYISTSGARYGLCQYTRDGGLYTGYLTQPMNSLQASPNMTMRGDNFILDSADIDYIEFRSNDTSAVIPSGSKFEIYIRR